MCAFFNVICLLRFFFNSPAGVFARNNCLVEIVFRNRFLRDFPRFFVYYYYIGFGCFMNIVREITAGIRRKGRFFFQRSRNTNHIFRDFCFLATCVSITLNCLRRRVRRLRALFVDRIINGLSTAFRCSVSVNDEKDLFRLFNSFRRAGRGFFSLLLYFRTGTHARRITRRFRFTIRSFTIYPCSVKDRSRRKRRGAVTLSLFVLCITIVPINVFFYFIGKILGPQTGRVSDWDSRKSRNRGSRSSAGPFSWSRVGYFCFTGVHVVVRDVVGG